MCNYNDRQWSAWTLPFLPPPAASHGSTIDSGRDRAAAASSRLLPDVAGSPVRQASYDEQPQRTVGYHGRQKPRCSCLRSYTPPSCCLLHSLPLHLFASSAGRHHQPDTYNNGPGLYCDASGCSCISGYASVLATPATPTVGAVYNCTKCASGFISVNETCVQCAAGTRSLAGLSCEPCGQNTYQPSVGSSSCLPCVPNASTYSQTGSTRCICNAGFQESFVTVNSSLVQQCNTCPDGAECISANGIAKAKPGYWYDSETQGYFACPNNYCCDATNGGPGCAVTDANRCYPHRHGFLCGDCDVGYSSISGRECVSCSSPNGPLLVILSGPRIAIHRTVFGGEPERRCINEINCRLHSDVFADPQPEYWYQRDSCAGESAVWFSDGEIQRVRSATSTDPWYLRQ